MKKRTRKIVTPAKGARKSKQGPPSAGAMLREVEKGQQAEADLIADLQMQGSTPKTSAARQEYKTWHATLVEPHVMLVVEDGDPFVQGIHSVLHYETSRKAGDPHAGKFLVAVGERLKDGNCSFLKTADGHWE